MQTKTLTLMSVILIFSVAGLAQDQGIIIGWGSNVDSSNSTINYDQATPPDGNDFTAIDAGLHHSIGLKSGGSIAAWGDDTYNQSSPPAGSYAHIAAGENHNVAIRTDGTLQAWGQNDKGQTNPPAGDNFIAVAAGAKHSLALRSDGTLVAWGVNSGGTSDFNYGQVTETPADSDFIAVAAGVYHSLAIAAEAGATAGTIRAWGRPDYGLGTPPPGNDFIAVAGGFNHSLALRSDGSLVAWGRDDGSIFDFGQVTDTPTGNGHIAIAAGYNHNVALKSDGTVVTWGKNNKGQATDSAGSYFMAVAAGGEHSLAIESNIQITRYTLSVYSAGTTNVAIDSSTGHGGVTDYFKTVASGTSVTLTAPATSDGATFTGWTGAVTDSSQEISLTMDASTSVTANYTTQYTLSVTSAGAGGVSINNPNNKGYGGVTDYTRIIDEGDTVWLIAPAMVDGKTFTGWTGSVSSTSTSILFTMDADTSVTANYQTPTQKYTLFVYSAGATAVTIDSSTGHDDVTNYTRTLDEETFVELTAPATASGSTFTGWTGSVTSASQTITLTMDAVKSVTANYETQYTLSVNSAGTTGVVISSTTGHGGITDYSHIVTEGAAVTLTAPTITGKGFVGWTGDITSPDLTIAFSMTADKNITANYINTYTLSTNIQGAGSVTPDPVGGTYEAGTIVELTATAATGWSFVRWEDDLTGSTNPDSIVMNANKTVTAAFEEDVVLYTLSTVIQGAGSVTPVPSGGTYASGTSVELTATAASGWHFDHWEGDLTGSVNPDSIVMNANKTVTAVFEEDTIFYTLSTSTVGTGSVTPDPVGGTYAAGTSVELTAIPASGWHFDHWEGDLGGSVNPDSIVMDGNKTVTAVFSINTFTLTYTAGPGGTLTGDPAQVVASGTDGTEVTAVPDPGYDFVDWSDGSTQNPRTDLNVTADISVTANFEEDTVFYTLTTSTAGSGTVTPVPSGGTYASGTSVELTATAASGWSFVRWEGDLTGSTNPDSIVMDGNKTVTAVFEEDTVFYTLTTSTAGSGTVTPVPSGGTYAAGTSVELTATAASGWSFVRWEGDLTGSTNPDSIVMDGNKTVTAVFEEDTVFYTLTTSTAGSGTVTPVPSGGTYASGTSVELTATAASGWSFVRWEGDLTGSTNPDSIVMDGNKTVTAVFEEDTVFYTLTTSTAGSGTVTPVPSGGTYASGTSVELTATAASGWSFVRWEGDLTGSANPDSIVMDGNKTVTAVFEEDTVFYTLTTNIQGSGSVTAVPSGGTYEAGTSVELTATAASGWSFVRWEGDLTGSANPDSIVMDGNKTVTAVFEEDTVFYTLSVTSAGTTGVVISSSTGHGGTTDYTQPDLLSDTEVTLTAPATSGGKTFTGWTGAVTSSSETINLTMDTAKTVTANYEIPATTHTLSVYCRGARGVMITSTTGHGGVTHYTQTVAEGSTLTLTAPTVVGRTFRSWTGAIRSDSPTITFSMDADTSVTANYVRAACDSSTVFVDAIFLRTLRGSPGWSFGYATVRILDDCGNPVANAQVTGIFTGDYSETLTATTNAHGIAIFKTDLEVQNPSYEFCVDDIVKPGLLYSPDDNVQTCASY